jgi:O-antigen/teichoic acid export membrane protein
MPPKSIRSDLSKLLTGNLGAQAIAILRGMIVPLLVSPNQFGFWRLVLLVWQYGLFLHGGSFSLLNRELPGMLSVGEHETASRMRQTGFWGSMLLAGVAAVMLVGFTFLPLAGEETDRLWALRLTAIGLMMQIVMMYVRLDHRVHSRFGRVSLVILAHGLGSLLFMIPLAHFYGVPGLAGGMLLATTFSVVAFGRRDAFERPHVEVKSCIRMALEGAPISSVLFLNTAIASIGQIASASILGLEASGFYGLGMMIGTVVYAIPRALGNVLYPRYLEAYALAKDPRQAGPLMRRSLRVISTTTAIIVCSAAILLDPVFTNVFPEYLPGLNATYALIAMMPFLSYALVLQNALLAFRLHLRVITLQLFFAAVSAALSVGFGLMFNEITWIAIAISTIGYGLSTLWLTFVAIGSVDRSPLRETICELPPIALMGASTVMMIVFWKPEENLASKILVPMAQLVALSPIAFLYCRKILAGTNPNRC